MRPIDDGELSELATAFTDLIPHSMWAIRAGMREAAGDDFTVPQYRVLAQLMAAPRTNGELSELLGVSVPSMSRTVELLVAAGYVMRIPQEHDRRQVKLELTLEGRRKFQRIRRHNHALFIKKFGALDAGRRQALRRGLAVLEELFP